MRIAVGDVTMMQRLIAQRYGFEPPAQYCAELIAFVETLTGEPRK